MSLAFSVASNSLQTRSLRSFLPSESTGQRMDEILANSKRFSGVAPGSIYGNPIQGSPSAYSYHIREEILSPVCDTNDHNWMARSATPLPLSPRQNHPMAAPLENLRNWCALTHSPWRDAEGKVLRYNCVQEAHIVSKLLKPDDVCRCFVYLQDSLDTYCLFIF